MELAIGALVLALVIWFFKSRGQMDGYRLLRSGVQARGILLEVRSQRSAKGNASQGFYELRNVSLDVEVPGKPPYECVCFVFIPANLRRLVLPGATLELRVDPRFPQNIAVFGPGVGLPADFGSATPR